VCRMSSCSSHGSILFKSPSSPFPAPCSYFPSIPLFFFSSPHPHLLLATKKWRPSPLTCHALSSMFITFFYHAAKLQLALHPNTFKAPLSSSKCLKQPTCSCAIAYGIHTPINTAGEVEARSLPECNLRI
jgi:hypothetical protein